MNQHAHIESPPGPKSITGHSLGQALVQTGTRVVSELQAGEEHAWDAYAQRARDAGVFHLSGWKRVLEKTYGHETHYLMVRNGSELCGILPLFVMRSHIWGTHVRSLPGGISSTDENSGQALLQAGMAITKQLDADHLLLSHGGRMWDGNLFTIQHHCTHRLGLPAQPELLWSDLSSKLRNKIRKAEKCQLRVVVGGQEYVDDFYGVISQHLRDMGTPIFDKRLIENMVLEFPGQTRLLVLKQEQRPVGAMCLLLFKDVVYDQWAASLRDFTRWRANELLYWEALRWACENAYAYFDFGRSQWGSGPFLFKEKWGAEACPLYYQYFLQRGTKIPDLNIRAERDLKYKLAIRLWQHLPVPVTLWLGPYLRKHLYPL